MKHDEPEAIEWKKMQDQEVNTRTTLSVPCQEIEDLADGVTTANFVWLSGRFFNANVKLNSSLCDPSIGKSS